MKQKNVQKRKLRNESRNALLMSCGIRFFMAAALTGNQTLGGYAPFALGCVAASGPGLGSLAALCGAALGAFFLMDFADALPFAAVCTLILASSLAFRGNRVLTGPRAVSLISAGLFLSVGLIYVLDAANPEEAFAACVAAAGLTGASAWFFWPLLHPGEGRSPAEGIIFLTAALLLSTQRLNFGGISPGRILFCVLLACASFSHGAATGAAIGLGLGLTADLCAESGGCVLTAAFGFGSLLCGRYAAGQRWRGALCFLGGVCAVLFSAGDPLINPLLTECGSGMLLFLLLPEKLFRRRRALPKPIRQESAKKLKERLKLTAAALRDLYDNCALESVVTEENPAIVFDRAAERSCRNCERCNRCWQEEYAATFQALNDATPSLLDRGYAVPADFPQSFNERCIHLTEFLTAVNLELSAYRLRGQYRQQLEETRRAARRQYAQLSELLSATAATDAAPASGAPQPLCRFGTALRPKRGESVCGDTALSFRTENGLWCLLLADGMGSGEEAKEESSLTCRLLRQFLEAGIRPESALRTLNSAMALRGEVTGSFTTMDLCTFDAFSGDAAFYKYGAAPSYLKKGSVVRRITGISLPVGLRDGDTAPDVTHVRLSPGSFAVMISDGVADPAQDQWLQSLLAGWEDEEPQELAKAIMMESLRRQASRDDRGVQILYWPAEKSFSA